MDRKFAMSVVSVLVLASMVLAGCGPGAAPATTAPLPPVERTVVVTAPPLPPIERTVVVTAPPVPQPGDSLKRLTLNFGAGDIPTIDPALTTDTSSVQVVELTTVGLMSLHEETGSLENGMAEKMDVSEDGLTYTFHLMDNVPWVRYNPASKQVEEVKDEDGNVRMVNANDFHYGIMRTLNPETASDYAYVLTTVIEGATEFNDPESGITDTASIGVTVVDTYTLEVKLTEPASFAPNILSLWIAHAQPQWAIEERGDRWTETGFFQGYGPYTLKSWNHESDITLVKNALWPGTSNIPQAKIDEVTWSMLDETAAFANYESGTLDAVGVPLTEIDRVKADPELSKQLKIAPTLCTYYYGFNVTKAPFDNPKVRQAFSMAIDRQSLIDNITKGGQEPAQWFARPGLSAAPTMQTNPDLGVKYNADEAKKLLAEAFPDTSAMPPVTLMVNQVEGHVKIAEAIKSMWKQALGVDVQLQQQEWKVFLQTLQDDPPQIFRLGWCADYPDANNFLKEVFHSGSAQNNTRWENPEYDRLVDEAARETDEAKRRELYVQAEEILVKTDAAIIPIYWYTRVTLTKPYVQRTFAQAGGGERIEKWDVQPH